MKYRIVLHWQGTLADGDADTVYTLQKETPTGWKYIKYNYKDARLYPYELTTSFSDAASWRTPKEISMKEFNGVLKSICEIDRELEKRSKWSFSVEQEFELL